MMKLIKKLNNNFNENSLYKRLILILLFIQIVGVSLSVLYNRNLEISTIYVVYSFIIFSLFSNIFVPKITKGDDSFILLINLLYTISLIILIRLDNNIAKNHVIWYCAGILAYLLSYKMISLLSNFIKDKFIFFILLTLLTFIITLKFGYYVGGAKNWISIGGFSIQLSEFAKILYIFVIGSYYNNYDKYINQRFGKYYLIIVTYIFALLFFYQGEMGTAIVFVGLVLASIFVFEGRFIFVLLNIIVGLIGIYLASFVLTHIKDRFDIWLDPWSEFYDRGYQIVQSLFSIANGGVFGTGIGLGNPNMVPLVVSDFILTGIIEEMGIFIGVSIIMLYILIFYKSIKIALQFNSKFYSSIAMTIGLLYSLQALIMYGGILKLIPLTGITTPFLSYGGSSTLSNFILLGVLQFISTKVGGNYEK